MARAHPALARFTQVSTHSSSPVRQTHTSSQSLLFLGPAGVLICISLLPEAGTELLGPRTWFLVCQSGSLVKERLQPGLCTRQREHAQGLSLQGVRGQKPLLWEKKDSKTPKPLQVPGLSSPMESGDPFGPSHPKPSLTFNSLWLQQLPGWLCPCCH